MTRTIYKYTLDPQDETTFSMPFGAEILCAQVQFGNPSIWALVDPEAPIVERTFMMIGTGQPFDASAPYGAAPYIGTVQLSGGHLVLHIFEKIRGQ